MPLFRILPWVTVAVVIGSAVPATAQLRSWQQGPRLSAPRSAPQSTVAGRSTTTAPLAQAVAPQPSASPWLPSTMSPANPGTAPRSTPTVVAQPSVRPIAHYPLPGAANATQVSATTPAATLGAPRSPYSSTSAAAISPYAAAFLAAQQPTPAPPLTGPANSAPIADATSQWTLPGIAETLPSPAPPMSQTPMPQSGPFDMLGSSCDPEEAVWEEPFDPGIPMNPARGCGPWFFSVSGLILSRDVPNNVELTSSAADPQQTLLNSEHVGTDEWLGGVEFRVGRMISDRWAVEFDYWSLEAPHETVSVYDPDNGLNSKLDFENLSYRGSPLTSVYDDSREQRLYRTWNVENMEINVLQQALMVDPIDRFGMTMFTGVRYFRFDEHWQYEAAAANTEFTDQNPDTQSNYWIILKNRMVGWQVGGRGHMRVGNRIRLFAMPRIGVMGTRIGQQQHVCMIIDEHATKTDVALLGQLDFGLSIQVFRCFSVFGSYRAMGIAGMAIADDNVARSFESTATLESINSSSSLILHGWQVGAQWQF